MKTVIGLFADKNEARRTIEDLKRVGAHDEDISIVAREGTADIEGIHLTPLDIPEVGRLAAGGPLTTFLHTSAAQSSPVSLAAALVRMGVPEREAMRYVEGVRQGCTLETVAIDDEHAQEALAIMQQHAIPASNVGNNGALGTSNLGTNNYGSHNVSSNFRKGDVGETETLQLGQEELQVGKREVNAGGLRVETHVTEQPVQEQINLREEHVDVERHRVDRPVTAGDTVFEERSIELTARAEMPVVQKTTRVIEEIVLRKDVNQRTETINDTVRTMDASVERVDQGFEANHYRSHFDTQYGASGQNDYDFDSYSPAYRFGSEMRTDTRFKGNSWDDIEPNARSVWEEKNPGTWDRFKGAVMHAWQKAKS